MRKNIYDFSKPGWEQEDFQYVYSPVCREFSKFIQGDGIYNSYSQTLEDYSYISMVSKQRLQVGAVVSTQCAFESFGAPLIVLSDDIRKDENGRLRYGLHFEVVAYEGGCNVWRIEPDPSNVKRPIKTLALVKQSFAISPSSMIEIRVQVKERRLGISVNDVKFDLYHPEIPCQFYAGITACEGINHFYKLELEEGKAE